MPHMLQDMFHWVSKTQCFSLGLVFELHAFKGALRFKEGGEGVEVKKKPSQYICPSNLDAEGWQRFDLRWGDQDN